MSEVSVVHECRYCDGEVDGEVRAASGMVHAACDAELVRRRDSGLCRACGRTKAVQDVWCGMCAAKDVIVYENFPGGGA